MSNLLINKTATEPDNIPPIDKYKKPFKIPNSTVPLVTVSSIILGVFWLLFMCLSAIYCNVVWYGLESCAAFTVSFWSVPILVGILAIVGIIGAAIYLIQLGINTAWIENLGVLIHRDDTRKSYQRGYDVILKRAESEATRGIDTYSPSYSNMAAKEPIKLISDQDPLIGAGISIADIFNHKEE